MPAIYVRLPEDARRALVNLAEREWRDPRHQATKLLVEGLERSGILLPEESIPQERAADRAAVTA